MVWCDAHAATLVERAQEYQLEEGECLVMENGRAMHGRTGWEAGTIDRHLQGCYVGESAQSMQQPRTILQMNGRIHLGL